MFPQSQKTDLAFRKKFKFLKTAEPFTYFCIHSKIREGLGSMAMPFFLLTLVMIPLLSCQSSRQNVAQNTESTSRPPVLSIPRWYAELPNADGCRLTYGYSGIYLDANLQKETLLKNSAENMAKNDEVFIKAGWAGSQTHSQGLSASYVIEKGWEDRASVLEKNLKVVREYRLGRGIIGLCAFCPDESLLQTLTNQIDDSLININADELPEWVREPKSHPQYIYGIGAASSRIKPGYAWEEAERQARADLAFNLAAHHDILLKTNSKSTSSISQKLSETKVEVTLKNVTIIRHAYSYASKSYYVLAQMPIPSAGVKNNN
jgi:hypothetical protein